MAVSPPLENVTAPVSVVPRYLVPKTARRFLTLPSTGGSGSSAALSLSEEELVSLHVLSACHLVGTQPASICWAELWKGRRL